MFRTKKKLASKAESKEASSSPVLSKGAKPPSTSTSKPFKDRYVAHEYSSDEESSSSSEKPAVETTKRGPNSASRYVDKSESSESDSPKPAPKKGLFGLSLASKKQSSASSGGGSKKSSRTGTPQPSRKSSKDGTYNTFEDVVEGGAGQVAKAGDRKKGAKKKGDISPLSLSDSSSIESESSSSRERKKRAALDAYDASESLEVDRKDSEDLKEKVPKKGEEKKADTSTSKKEEKEEEKKPLAKKGEKKEEKEEKKAKEASDYKTKKSPFKEEAKKESPKEEKKALFRSMDKKDKKEKKEESDEEPVFVSRRSSTAKTAPKKDKDAPKKEEPKADTSVLLRASDQKDKEKGKKEPDSPSVGFIDRLREARERARDKAKDDEKKEEKDEWWHSSGSESVRSSYSLFPDGWSTQTRLTEEEFGWITRYFAMGNNKLDNENRAILMGLSSSEQDTGVKVAPGANVRLADPQSIGRDVHIGLFSYINGNVQIGDEVTIGPNCTITSNTHLFNVSAQNYKHHNRDDPIFIKRGCWIAAGVTIAGGVTIGECSLVCAGAVVTKDIPDYSIVAGVPARLVGFIDPSTGEKNWSVGGAGQDAAQY